MKQGLITENFRAWEKLRDQRVRWLWRQTRDGFNAHLRGQLQRMTRGESFRYARPWHCWDRKKRKAK